MQTYIPTPIKAVSAIALLQGYSISDWIATSSSDHRRISVKSCTYNPSGGWVAVGEVFVVAGDRSPKCPVISDAALFQRLVHQWHQERGATSSITDMILCTSYQRIIGMGERAVPLILRRLELEADDPDHWGWALHCITGENPVPPEAAGDALQIAQAWLSWACH
jgi:hypothetical protein